MENTSLQDVARDRNSITSSELRSLIEQTVIEPSDTAFAEGSFGAALLSDLFETTACGILPYRCDVENRLNMLIEDLTSLRDFL